MKKNNLTKISVIALCVLVALGLCVFLWHCHLSEQARQRLNHKLNTVTQSQVIIRSGGLLLGSGTLIDTFDHKFLLTTRHILIDTYYYSRETGSFEISFQRVNEDGVWDRVVVPAERFQMYDPGVSGDIAGLELGLLSDLIPSNVNSVVINDEFKALQTSDFSSHNINTNTSLRVVCIDVDKSQNALVSFDGKFVAFDIPLKPDGADLVQNVVDIHNSIKKGYSGSPVVAITPIKYDYLVSLVGVVSCAVNNGRYAGVEDMSTFLDKLEVDFAPKKEK